MNISQYEKERRQVAAFMKRLYDRQLTTASGGNISLRISDELFCITPSALDKGMLTFEDVAVVSMDGKNLTPTLPLSIETEMHRLSLIARPDCRAIVHAHPIYTSAFTAITKDGKCAIDTTMIAESYFILEKPVFVPYRLMGTVNLAEQVAIKAFDHTVLLLENHGAVALGTSLLEAFDKIELLERAAQMTTIAVQMASHGYDFSPLDEARCAQLMRMKYGNK